MAIDRAGVVETELLEQGGRHDHALGMFFYALGQFEQRRCTLEHGFADILGSGIKLPGHELGQIAVQRANRRADAHVVVVQDHQQIAVGHAGVVECLERHAGGQRTVSDDGYRAPVFPLDFGRQRHAQRSRDGGAGVCGAERVVVALAALRETAQAAQLPQGVHAFAPAGQYLVRIGLVAHVPYQPVVRGIEHIVQRHREFHRAEVGAQVAAGLGHAGQQKGAQLVG